MYGGMVPSHRQMCTVLQYLVHYDCVDSHVVVFSSAYVATAPAFEQVIYSQSCDDRCMIESTRFQIPTSF